MSSRQHPTGPSTVQQSVMLHNMTNDKVEYRDALHQKTIEHQGCSESTCIGSLMRQNIKRRQTRRTNAEILTDAKDFMEQYYASLNKANSPEHMKRWNEVQNSVNNTGTYDPTFEELEFGAKTAWRNAPRCIGRIQWTKLQLFDSRKVKTAKEMFECICRHIKYATNKGNLRQSNDTDGHLNTSLYDKRDDFDFSITNFPFLDSDIPSSLAYGVFISQLIRYARAITHYSHFVLRAKRLSDKLLSQRSAITIFPQRTDGLHDFRVFNQQVIRYAGYRQGDGSVIGDPVNIDFTEYCQSLGWEGKQGMFDVLPLVLQANGGEPEIFEIPPELVLEVNIKHPKFQKISEMNLKWFALPGVSNMLFDCGGIEFTAAPFSGWYMETEVGARDFCDAQRYNLAEKVALKMGLDTKDTSSLWKDKAAIEMNVAVLHSFREQGVTIMDHHSASESFMTFFENEQKTRGGCPADWVWIVPPISGSLTEVFHQEMLMYKLKPSYEYQDEVWRLYVKGSERQNQLSFRSLAVATKVIVRTMKAILAFRKRCVVLYATETARSEKFAKQLFRIFESSFNAKVACVADYNVKNLQQEDLVLIVTSTTGNGDPPENGKAFKKSLLDLQAKFTKKSSSQETPYSKVSYSVFGLGSRAYPHFCAFAQLIDGALENLGMQRISQMALGDELSGQEETFKRWSKQAFKDSCDRFQIKEDAVKHDELDENDFTWKPGKFRISLLENQEEPSLSKCLTELHNRAITTCELVQRKQLQAKNSDRETILIKLDTCGNTQLNYTPGDHLAIFPVNSPKIVEGIISRMTDPSRAKKLLQVEIAHQKSPSWVEWEDFKRLPMCTVRTALSRFLDITTPPTLEFMKSLAMQTGKRKDIAQIENLVNDIDGFEEWKQVRDPNILEVLEVFPSLRVDPTLLLTQLPLLQQRYYSISSSPKAYPREIHATVAVLKYNTMGGDGPEHEGVCSTWLNKCDIGETIYCAIREAPLFHLPEDPTLPIVMVGAGTGIAPFRSFWQQRHGEKDTAASSSGTKKGSGDMDIYFGCRESTKDNIYKDELDACKDVGVLSQVNVALSREPGQTKTYVQDMLLQNEERVYNQIMKKGHVYICGDAFMASDVESTLENILKRKGKMRENEAKERLAELKAANLVHEDIFGANLKAKQEQAKNILSKMSGEKKVFVVKSAKTENSAVCILL